MRRYRTPLATNSTVEILVRIGGGLPAATRGAFIIEKEERKKIKRTAAKNQ